MNMNKAIAVMNTSGVALAASNDTSFNSKKIYEEQSSDEDEAILAYEAVKREVETLTSQLFTLSKQAPDHYLVQGEALLEKALNVLEKDYINEFDNSDFRLMTEKFSEEID